MLTLQAWDSLPLRSRRNGDGQGVVQPTPLLPVRFRADGVLALLARRSLAFLLAWGAFIALVGPG